MGQIFSWKRGTQGELGHIFHFFRVEEDRGQMGKSWETTFQTWNWKAMCRDQKEPKSETKEPLYKNKNIAANITHLSTAVKHHCSNFSALGPRLLKSHHSEETSKPPPARTHLLARHNPSSEQRADCFTNTFSTNFYLCLDKGQTQSNQNELSWFIFLLFACI